MCAADEGQTLSRRHTSPSVEKRCHDLDKIRYARNKVSNPFFEFDYANGPKLEAEIAQEPLDVILDGLVSPAVETGHVI
jgi:hypothetical protein